MQMPLLFNIDPKDYDPNGVPFIRPSARCIIIRDSKIAMVYSRKYDYYKFPGGGIEKGETLEEAVIRETEEETGLMVSPESVEPFGYVHRIQRSDLPGVDLFIQDNFYFFGSAEKTAEQKLDDYESEEGFVLRWVDPGTAIETNRAEGHGPKDRNMLFREARVLEILLEEGRFRL